MHYGEQILREPSSLTSFGKYKVRGINVLFEDYIKEHPQHSPVRTQYLQIKRQNPDAILFFRMGDFYEMFDDDAEIVGDAQIGLAVIHLVERARVRAGRRESRGGAQPIHRPDIELNDRGRGKAGNGSRV